MSSGTSGPASLVGRVIDGYRLERVLGKGATGIVFLGRRADGEPALIEQTRVAAIELPVEAAIKVLVLPWQLDDDERAEFRRRFLREADTLRRLQHPHILRIITYGEDEATDSPYMILPYLSGGTLQGRLANHTQPLPLPEVERLLAQIADAVDYAHRQGIVHRDIKPGNILLDAQGEAFLSDFSIARMMVDATTRLTRTGLALGTPMYMAPEALAGQEGVSPAADIYSLGMVAYELVVGPRANATNAPPPPRTLRPDLPEPAEAAILRALDPNPTQRFPTATAFAQAFAQGLQGQWSPGLMTRRATSGAQSATNYATTQSAFTQPTQRVNDGRRRRRTGALLGAVALLVVVACVAAVFALPGRPLLAMFGSHTPTAGAQATTTLTQTVAPTGSLTPGVKATATAKKTITPGGKPTTSPVPGAPPTATTVLPPTATSTPTLPSLVISANASQSTDGQAHGSGNPYYFTGNQTYGNVTIQSGAWATGISACSGGGSGTVIFSATGTVTINGTLTVNSEGYCGGQAIQGAGGGMQGWSYAGSSQKQSSANYGGGGGGGSADNGGAGGGYGTAGSNAYFNSSTLDPTIIGGQTYGDPTLATLYLGSGGGSSGAQSGYSGGAGGNGGGAISITANSIIVTGVISANGGAGISVPNTTNNYRGGGGGSGGSILLHANSVSISGTVTATGGSGGYGNLDGTRVISGGPGGVGRVRVHCPQANYSHSGSISPTPYVG